MASKSLVSGHELNRLLDRVAGKATALRSSEFQKLLDDSQRAGVQRVFFFVQQLKEHLSRVSDFEVSLQALDTLQNQLQAVFNELNAFETNRNAGHVTNAVANLEGALQTFSWAFYRRPAKGSATYGETIQSIEKAAANSIEEIQKSRDDLATSLNDLKVDVTAQQEALEGLKQASQDLTSQNSAALQNFENRYDELAGRFEKDFSTKVNELERRFDSFEDKKIEEANGFIKKLETSEAKAREIVQIVGNIGLTGNYQNRASSERSQADVLRIGAILFFLAGAIILGVSVLESFGGTVEPIELAARALAALTISAPAFYLAKESARHRSNSDRAKQTELELASLTPFLDSLPAETRQEVIQGLSKSYFGRDIQPHQVTHPAELTADEIIKLFLRFIESGK